MQLRVSPSLTFHAPPRDDPSRLASRAPQDEGAGAGSGDAPPGLASGKPEDRRRRRLARAGELLKLLAALRREEPTELLLSIVLAEARRFAGPSRLRG